MKPSIQHQLLVHDILVASWGYDQTNIDYYQVTKLIGAQTVEIRKIAAQITPTGFMSGQCLPVIHQFIGNPMKKRVIGGDGKTVKIDSHAWARKRESSRADHYTAYA